MSSSFDKFQKRRLITSYFSVVISVGLVLFMLGLLALFVTNAKKLSDDFKEGITMTVFFKDDAQDTTLVNYGKMLKTAKFAKKYSFVSKEQAAKQHEKTLGENFTSFLGVNPLKNSYDIFLRADYVDNDSVSKIEQNLRKDQYVADIFYDKQLVKMVNENVKKASLWILVISGFLTVVAVLLINSSLRLSIYANRFIIKTMQMVGATKSFIRKPFIAKSLKLGMLGAGVAILGLLGVLFYIDSIWPTLGVFDNTFSIIIILLAVFGAGVLITWVSTYFATQRFLNLRTDDLY